MANPLGSLTAGSRNCPSVCDGFLRGSLGLCGRPAARSGQSIARIPAAPAWRSEGRSRNRRGAENCRRTQTRNPSGGLHGQTTEDFRDGLSEDASCLAARLKKKIPNLVDISDLPSLQVPFRLKPPLTLHPRTEGFQLAFFTRMVFPLIDAYFLTLLCARRYTEWSLYPI